MLFIRAHRYAFGVILPVLLFLFGCKKNPVPDPAITVSVQDINNGFRLSTSISNVKTEDILESGLVWGENENLDKGAALSYLSPTPLANFSYDVVAGFTKGKRYFVRAYFIDQDHQLRYSEVVAFEGKNTFGLNISLPQQAYTWGDEVEVKVTNANGADLASATIVINGKMRLKPSKTIVGSVFFKVPVELYTYQNSVSLELYNQAGLNAYFILQPPQLPTDFLIVDKVGGTVKLTGNYFNPNIDSNIVMIGTTKLEVLKAERTALELKLPLTEFSYSGNFSVQTGKDLITTSKAVSKVYRFLTQVSEQPGVARYSGIMENINGKIYCGLGSDIDTRGLSDFYEYNPVASTWRKLADFPATLYGAGVSFTVKNKLVFITNAIGTAFTTDVYQFDIANNTWKKSNSYPGTMLRNYTLFASDNYGYMLGGEYTISTNYGYTVKSFKRFDPATDTWKTMPDFPGTSRKDFKSFKVGNSVIVFGGHSVWGTGESLYPTDSWSFDLVSETWKKIKDVPSYINAVNSFSFEVKGKAYIGGGMGRGGVISSSIYEYDPIADTFVKKDNIIDKSMLVMSAATSVGGHGYIMFGKPSYDYHLQPLKEVFRFDP
jgi:N-acetylneuraminic acid mutarotase